MSGMSKRRILESVVLFFEKGAPTGKTWFCQLDPGRNPGKTNPLNDVDLIDFIDRPKSFADSDKSWIMLSGGSCEVGERMTLLTILTTLAGWGIVSVMSMRSKQGVLYAGTVR